MTEDLARRTAWHEAGHAVTAVAYAIPFTEVAISDAGGGYIARPSNFDMAVEWLAPEKDGAERRAEDWWLFCEAGMAANRALCAKYGLEYIYRGGFGDLESAGFVTTGLGFVSRPFHRRLKARMRQELPPLLPQIEAVAAALLERRRLTEAEVRDILAATPAAPFSDRS